MGVVPLPRGSDVPLSRCGRAPYTCSRPAMNVLPAQRNTSPELLLLLLNNRPDKYHTNCLLGNLHSNSRLEERNIGMSLIYRKFFIFFLIPFCCLSFLFFSLYTSLSSFTPIRPSPTFPPPVPASFT